MQLKIRAIIVVVLLLAFLWGYKRDAVLALFSGADSPTEIPATNPSDTAEAPPATPNPTQPENASQNGAMPNSNFVGEVSSPGSTAANTVPAPNVPIQTFPQGTPAPFGGVQPGASPQRPSLAQTLDSIRPGEITEQMKEQRDLYIQKLAQQLRENQGGDPMATPVQIFPGAQPFATPPLMPLPSGPVPTPFDQPPVQGFPEATPPHSQGMPLPPLDQIMPHDPAPDPDQVEEDDDDEDAEEDDDSAEDDTDADDEVETITAM